MPAASAVATLNDHLAGNRSRCESGGDIDRITDRREVVDGCAQPGRPNECHAGMDSRSYWNGHQRRAGLCCPLGQVDCCCYRYWWCGPLIPPKNSPMTSSPTTVSTMPSWATIEFDASR
jgi:hypothetical protein